MKKYFFVIVICVVVIGSLLYYYFFKKDNNHVNESQNNMNNHSYTAEKTSTIDNTITNTTSSNNNNLIDNTSISNTESELSSFSTKIYKDTKARYSNIELACETLNNTIVKSGTTFSLWDVLGCPTKDKGYEKAKTFTSDGDIIKSYGGGICQVSTTLYNAVLEVKDLDVKERHEHSRDVKYIKDGKDASVSYNSADFKFKNNLNHDIKIEAKVEDNKVKIKLLRI